MNAARKAQALTVVLVATIATITGHAKTKPNGNQVFAGNTMKCAMSKRMKKSKNK